MGFAGLDSAAWRFWWCDITGPTLRIGDIPVQEVIAVSAAYVGVDYWNLSGRKQPKKVIIISTIAQM